METIQRQAEEAQRLSELHTKNWNDLDAAILTIERVARAGGNTEEVVMAIRTLNALGRDVELKATAWMAKHEVYERVLRVLNQGR